MSGNPKSGGSGRRPGQWKEGLASINQTPRPDEPEDPSTMKEPYARIAELEAKFNMLIVEVSSLKDLAQITRLVLEGQGAVEKTASEPDDLSAGYATRDHVQLIGIVLQVNGQKIKLSEREAVLMAILMRYALSGESGFLPTPEIIEAVDFEFTAFWNMPLPTDVNDVVYRVRNKLDPGRDLLESAPNKGGGYRISTPRSQIEPLKTSWVCNTEPGFPA